ncbi:MAG: hypothetical protein CVU05_14670 [Bacteroidetes bacterium HGW-Bacteroidetes-21]|nr:MAG: hypothetical protein CVU05_14670 [Bacteroidetes bacterium HGW-Bacteroidetes-21]
MILVSDITKGQCDDQLIEICYPEIGDFKFLKSYQVRFKKSKKDAPLMGKNVLVLTENTNYRIVVCNASDYDGKLIFKLFQSSTSTMVGCTLDPSTNKIHNGFEFKCKSSGIYYLNYYFQDGREGCSVIMCAEKPTR